MPRTFNVELLRRVSKRIIDNPESFIMHRHCVKAEQGRFILDSPPLIMERTHDTPPFQVKPECGTAACIGGWICLEVYPELPIHTMPWGEVKTIVVRELGLRIFEADELLYLEKWPPDVRKAFQNAKTAFQRAGAAQVAIEDFITKISAMEE